MRSGFGWFRILQRLPHEQYIRDQNRHAHEEPRTCKRWILSLEKPRDNGEQLRNIMGDMANTLGSEEGGEALAEERMALGKAMAAVQGMLEAMLPKAMESVYHVGLHANRILFSVGDTF